MTRRRIVILVAEIRDVAFAGLPARLLWRAVFLGEVPGWQNRLRVSLGRTIGSLFERDLARLER